MDTNNDENLQEFSEPLIYYKSKKSTIKQSTPTKKKKDKKHNNNDNTNNNTNHKNSNSSAQTGLRSNASTYSILPISEVTQGALEVWAQLPDEIRQDPALASFQKEHERIHGGSLTLDDQDPLPNDDIPGIDDQPINNDLNTDCITINVSNENGQKTKDPLDISEFTVPPGPHSQINATNETEEDPEPKMSQKILKSIKIALLVCVWIAFTAVLMSSSEKILTHRQLSIPAAYEPKNYILMEKPLEPRFAVHIKGAFVDENSNTSHFLYIQVMLLNTDIVDDNETDSSNLNMLNEDKIYRIPMMDDLDSIDVVPEVKRVHTFHLNEDAWREITQNDTKLRLRIYSNLPISIPINMAYDPTPIDKSLGVIYAAVVLFGLYAMIIWEIVHRTFAAMLASTMSIALLAYMNERPTMPEIMSWIDIETLLLLFGMMILVAIMSETGIFDYLAVYAFKITSGQIWPLINCLCLFTAITSSFLDNVTTVLLMTPVSIRLCEVMQLNPVPILMAMVIYSNIGGALTPVGDPPNVIVASNAYIVNSGVTFLSFTMHMTAGIVFVMIQSYIQLRYKFRNLNDLRFIEPQSIQELRHEIVIWQRAAASLSSYSKDEDLVRETLLKKVARLKRQLKKKLSSGSAPPENYQQTLEELQQKYPIRNWPLLIKSGVTLVFAISFFFLQALPEIQRLSLGWTALLAAILLLILADREDMESILARVEWSTLLFFAALFVLMESLSGLGLIDWIGLQTENIILSVNEEHRLTVAILLILWVSAIASAFVDNIPLTTMMIKVSISLAEKKALNLPLQPLVWALCFGACLGGNGTLIGASANVVCAGVAEQHGYRFTFVEYFKVGFPIMIGGVSVATAYLLFCHVCFAWH